MRLAKLAFYDEALSLVRSIGEIVNLLALFAADKAAIDEWKKGDRKYRQNHFSPMQVRVRLENLKELILMDEDRYRTLCELSTHPVPELTPQQFNTHKKSMAGGLHVQVAGFLVVLNEVALLESLVVFNSVRLCDVPKAARMQIQGLRGLGESRRRSKRREFPRNVEWTARISIEKCRGHPFRPFAERVGFASPCSAKFFAVRGMPKNAVFTAGFVVSHPSHRNLQLTTVTLFMVWMVWMREPQPIESEEQQVVLPLMIPFLVIMQFVMMQCTFQ
jgi:hypothetical protein